MNIPSPAVALGHTVATASWTVMVGNAGTLPLAAAAAPPDPRDNDKSMLALALAEPLPAAALSPGKGTMVKVICGKEEAGEEEAAVSSCRWCSAAAAWSLWFRCGGWMLPLAKVGRRRLARPIAVATVVRPLGAAIWRGDMTLCGVKWKWEWSGLFLFGQSGVFQKRVYRIFRM